ncbi:glycoside hydrolase family 19 protein [Chondromyces crocatus]|uniref:Glycoside hydrolase family 19 catalytic domain-containing protein n=1 Tax=Chondromyces crocatus TaxID=52 RepID=A0A0K1ECJ4_CHOCO|nr:hypothetical protein [Chondromyces crocatus]AKT38417.1 uncharacterized protein CMC5_025630 [Chondromyces crocatus]
MSGSNTPTNPGVASGGSPIVLPDQVPLPVPRPVREGEQTPTSPNAGDEATSEVDSTVAACPNGCPRCCAKITTQQVKDMWPSAASERIEGTKDAFNEFFEKFEINTCLRKAHFFAQVMKEVGPKIRLVESLDYTPAALKSTFSYYRNNPDMADLHGRVPPDQAADQEAIGNHAYGSNSQLGNDSIESGNGYKYRGRGYIQVTGKYNYEQAQKHIDSEYPGSGVDIVTNPETLGEYRTGMIASMAYWKAKKINLKADMGSTGDDVDRVTEIVNKHTKTYADRRKNFEDTTKVVFKVAECPNHP